MELTKDKLDFLADITPGSRAIFRIEDDHVVALYLSPSLHTIVGMDDDEFRRATERDTADMVVPEDLPDLTDAIRECIRTKAPMNRYWRIRHPEQGFIWVHGNASYCGEYEGYPVLLVTFGADSDEVDLYKDVVDSSRTMVYVCDCHTYEILYANKAAREYGGNTQPSPLGGMCYSFIKGKDSPCEDCFMKTVGHGEYLNLDRFDTMRGIWEHLSGKYIDWCGHDAFIQYLQDITEIKTSQQELEKSQKRERDRYNHAMQSLLSANPEALCSFQLNLSGNTVMDAHGASPYILKTLRSDTADGVLSNAASIIIDPADRDRFAATFGRKSLLAAYDLEEMGRKLDYRRKGEDGHPIWVRTYVNLLKEPDDEDVIAVIYSIDITREVIAEQALHVITEQAYDYAMVLHLDTGMFSMMSISGRLKNGFVGRFGDPDKTYDYELLRNMSLDSLADQKDRQLYAQKSSLEYIRQEMERSGNYEFEAPARFTDDPDEVRYRKFEHFYLSREDGTVLVLGSDVTGLMLQKQKEAEIARSEAKRVTDILDSITAGISVLRMSDPDHLTYDYVNQQMYRMLGFPKLENDLSQKDNISDKVIVSYLEDGFAGVHPDDLERVKKTFHDNFDSPLFTVDTYRTQGADGRYYWLKQSVRMHEAAPDHHIFYSVYNDVQKEVMLQQERERQLEAEKSLRRQADIANAAKSEFLSRMSHDMRTPLNVILGITHLSKEREHTQQTIDELDKIDRSSKFLLGLINDVLDMSKAESGKMSLHPEPYTPDEFNGFIDSVARPLCEEKGLELLYNAESVEGYAPLMDKLRSNQVLFNLLSNAIKFTPEGGTVTVRLHEQMTPDGRIELEVAVSDTGIGMSQEFQSKLFEPFMQEQRNDASPQRGTGLGLSITKKIVDMMGGTIDVQSTMGKGTTFTLRGRFDCVPSDQTSDYTAAATPTDAGALSGKHVLLCEDHPLNQEIAEALLQEKGIVVDLAENGQVGLQKFSRSAPGYYDALLMDIRMPMMDGYAATAAIRALDRPDAKTVPIVAMTADAFTDDVRKCLASGMDGHIAKPIDAALMYHELQNAIEHGHVDHPEG